MRWNVLDDCGDCGGDNGAQDICGVCDVDNSSCSGCTDPLALNFDSTATIDDGSCIYPIFGCTDSSATNYNPLATNDDGSCTYLSVNLSLQGIIDFTVPSGGSDGKAIHLLATDSIADLSIYGIGVANNGGGTDGLEYVFPVMSVSAGDHILLARTPSAMASYFDVCYSEFDHVLTATSSISQNGDDAIELFMNSSVVETFGDINVDGTGECWEYMDSWAYKSSGDTACLDGNWIFGGVNCTDGSTTTFSSSCPYPLCPPPQTGGCTDSTAIGGLKVLVLIMSYFTLEYSISSLVGIAP